MVLKSSELQNPASCYKGSFMDSYHYLTYKSIMGTYWASHYCEQADFVIKTDDDVFDDMFATYHFTRYLFPNKVS